MAAGDKVRFISTDEMKAHFNVTSIKVAKNPKTDKLFCIVDSEQTLKCQQDINLELPLAFICSEFNKRGEPVMEEACLINVKEGVGATILHTL
jgi:hypothetical protein